MSKTIAYLVVCVLAVQVITSWLRYPNSSYHILLILPLLVLGGCIFYLNFFKNPLKRCPLCKRWLKINDYKYISNDGIKAVILCQKCNGEYEIKKINAQDLENGCVRMGLIARVKKKLDEEYPHIKYEIKDNVLTVPSADKNGFEVGVYLESKEWVVFGGKAWHEHFSDEEAALNCFGCCLNNKYRLKTYFSGNFEYKGTLERLEDGQWHEIDTIGLLFYPFWRKRTIKYLQNNLVDSKN
jgi:hypothetical protein